AAPRFATMTSQLRSHSAGSPGRTRQRSPGAPGAFTNTHPSACLLRQAPGYCYSPWRVSILPRPRSTRSPPMHRRQWLKRSTLGAGPAGLPGLLAGKLGSAPPVAAQATPPPAAGDKKLEPLKITDVKTILTAPANIRLVVVKVLTSEPGLYG